MTIININGTEVKCWRMRYNPCGLSEYLVKFDGKSFDELGNCFADEESIARSVYDRVHK